MRIGDVIAAVATTCFILLQRACARDQVECEESVSEKITRTIDGIRFHLAVNSTWCHVPDEQLLSYRSVFDLIPKENLADVPVGSWTILCNHFSQDVGFVSKVLDLLKNDPRLVYFLNNITVAGGGLAGNSYSRHESRLLQMVAEDLVHASVDEESALRPLFVNRALLLSVPPYFLLTLNDVKKNLLMYVAAGAKGSAEADDAFWKQQSPLTRRSWSTILTQQLSPNSRIVSFIKQQPRSSFFQVLDTINTDELQNILTALDGDPTFDPAFFRSVDWNTVQIRKIADFHFQHWRNWSTIDLSDNVLSRLLPVQIASWLAANQNTADAAASAILNHFRNVDEIPLAQALQLFECIVARLLENFSTPSLPYCAWVGKLLYSQTNAFVSRLYDDQPSKLNMTLVKCADSDRYSLLQRHYIFGRHFGRNQLQGDEIDRVLNVKGLMAAIPASFYIGLVESPERRGSGSLQSHFHHILKYFPARANKMAAIAAFHACNFVMVPSKCVTSVLENNDNEMLYAAVSPLHVRKYRREIWQFLRNKVQGDEEFKRRIAHFPSFVMTELLDQLENVITYRQFFNETYPSALVISAFNCEILSRIPSCEFLPIFQLYNEQRKLYNKEFPKDLQKCAQRAFLRHLRTKSNVSYAPLKDHLLQYLDLADIRSIGGYVLATLPASSIAKSNLGRYIVAEIGRLSLSELLLAVTPTHLASIASQYLKNALGHGQTTDRSNGNVRMEHLITLGNLTHFLDDEYVRRIDPSAFKFLLEAEFIDTRICAASFSIRKTWADKLLETFGWPETWDENTLLRMGDMLIVLNETSFRALNTSACSRVVDLMDSKYTRFVDWPPRPLPFYQVCSAILSPNERVAYHSSIQRLALFYAKSIELLLRTTVPVAQRNATEVVVRMKRAASNGAIQSWSSTIDLPFATIATTTTTTLPAAAAAAATSTTAIGDGDDDADADADADDIEASAANAQKTKRPVPFASTLATGSSNETKKSRDGSDEIEVSSADATADNRISETTIDHNTDVSSPSSATDRPSEATRPSTQSSVPRDTATTVATATATATTATTFSKVTDYRSSDATFSTQTDAHTDTNTVTIPDYTSTTSNSDLSTRHIEMTTVADDGRNGIIITNDSTPKSWKTEATVSSASTALNENVSFVSSPGTTAADFAAAASVAMVDDAADEKSATRSYAFETTAASTAADSAFRTSSVAFDGVKPTITTDDAGSKSTTPPPPPPPPLHRFSADELRQLLEFILNSRRTPKKAMSTYRHKRQAAAESEIESSFGGGGDGDTESLNVSCNTLRILDGVSDFILKSPRVNVVEAETFDCIELLARMDSLDKERRKTIWSGVASKLSNENLTFVAGKVLAALDERDLLEINLDVRSPGALELIGVLSQVLPADDRISHKILKDNRNFDDTKDALYSVVARALGPFMCQDVFETTYSRLFQRLKDDQLAERTVFDTLEDCPAQCLRKIANAAVAALGDPLEWPPVVFTKLGPVVAAIPNASSLIYRRSANISRYISASAFARLHEFAAANGDGDGDGDDHAQYHLDSLPLTAAMLLLENDCVSKYRDCAFATSLADVILSEDSLSLVARQSKVNSSDSTPPARSGASTCASVSPSFLLLLLLNITVASRVGGKVIELLHLRSYASW